jgi:hypothetical protein
MAVSSRLPFPTRFRNWLLLGALALRALSIVSVARAEPAAASARPDRSATSGLALALGWGNETAGFGGVVHYYFQIPDSRFRVAVHAGVGGHWAGTNAVEDRWRLAGSGGVSGTFGRRQRFLFDLWGAPTGVNQHLSLHGETAKEWRPLYGIGLNLGWEFVSRRGFVMRSSIGPAYAFHPRIFGEIGRWNVSGNLLTLGYKLW